MVKYQKHHCKIGIKLLKGTGYYVGDILINGVKTEDFAVKYCGSINCTICIYMNPLIVEYAAKETQFKKLFLPVSFIRHRGKEFSI